MKGEMMKKTEFFIGGKEVEPGIWEISSDLSELEGRRISINDVAAALYQWADDLAVQVDDEGREYYEGWTVEEQPKQVRIYPAIVRG